MTTVKPDPDPTFLTTQQLLREIENLEKVLGSRIVGVEKAIDVAHQDLVRVPTAVDKAIGTLQTEVWLRFDTFTAIIDGIKATYAEKFDSIQTQFTERDTRVEQSAKAGAEALSAALQAAKEAVGAQQLSNTTAIEKQERNTKEQITSLSNLITQITKSIDDRISELKGRVDKKEGSGSGHSDMIAWAVAGFSLLSNIALILFYVSKAVR